MEAFSGGRGDNPDQRISEDIDSFTSQSLSLMQGLLQAVTTIVCFIVVLWNLSETLTFTLWGYTFHLEGYLVWTALLYSVAGTWVTHQVGKKLIALNYEQQKREANFRFGMMRLRDTAESVAFYHGGGREKETLFSRFLQAVSNQYMIIRKNKQLWTDCHYFPICGGGSPVSHPKDFSWWIDADCQLFWESTGFAVLSGQCVHRYCSLEGLCKPTLLIY